MTDYLIIRQRNDIDSYHTIEDEVADCRGGAAKQTRCEIMSGDDLLTELVGNARTLAELRDALDSVEFSDNYDISNLPTFGGPDVDYDEVWSWDEGNILLACYRGLGQYEYEIVERCPTCRVKPIECCDCEY